VLVSFHPSINEATPGSSLALENGIKLALTSTLVTPSDLLTSTTPETDELSHPGSLVLQPEVELSALGLLDKLGRRTVGLDAGVHGELPLVELWCERIRCLKLMLRTCITRKGVSQHLGDN